MTNSISLMFSGGVDSTVAAMHLADRFDQVYLLTFDNGYGTYGFDRTRRRAAELMLRYPGVFEHTVTSIRSRFECLALDSLKEDYLRHRSAFSWCLGCKLAMHVESVIFDQRHDITRHTDGSSGDSPEMVEQIPEVLSAIQGFYQNHGVHFAPTDFDMARDAKRALLKEKGFKMGIPIRDRYLRIQPSCIPGELYYLPWVLVGQPPRHDLDEILEFVARQRPVMDRMVQEAMT